MNLAKFPPHTFHARCCKCIFWENIASIPPSPLLWMTDVDVSAVGVFMLLSYSELRGLLVLVSFIHPRHHSHHTHHAGSWDFIHNHRILMIMSTLQHYTTQWTRWRNVTECLNQMSRKYLSRKKISFPPDVTVFAWCPDSDTDRAHMLVMLHVGGIDSPASIPLLQDPPLISSKKLKRQVHNLLVVNQFNWLQIFLLKLYLTGKLWFLCLFQLSKEYK